MHLDFKSYLLKVTKSSDCKEVEVIQSLWSGYGKISRYQLINSSIKTVVVKCISLNQVNEHPRGWNSSFSHNRKVKSYEIETNWYEQWSELCSDTCRIPSFIGSFSEKDDQWIIMEDLNTEFPVRKPPIDLAELKVCLKWLANFHVTFLGRKPDGLWDEGTYWHLKTRPDEFELIEHNELKAKAHILDEILNNCRFMTIVHGDAKLANFCFSADGKKVAAVDFQYVGGGCGMKDVAYLFGSCLSSQQAESHHDMLLTYYFSELRIAFEITSFDFSFSDLEVEWRKMYPIACTDFMRFLYGWMPTHQKINNYNQKMMKEVLAKIDHI